MDKIFIRALKTEAIIGIFDWERQVKQTVIIDIEIGADYQYLPPSTASLDLPAQWQRTNTRDTP